MRSVLIVDDEDGVRVVMRRWLESKGYAVTEASNADQAVDTLACGQPTVAVCDLRMPGHDGLWLTDLVRKQFPETAVIIATGVNDVEAAVEGLRQGVVDYLTKPFDRERLFDAVARGVEWSDAATDARRWCDTLEQEMHDKQAALADLVGRWPVDSPETLDGLLSMLLSAQPDLYAHGYRVSALAGSLAGALGLGEGETQIVEHAALMHDLGKLAVPDAILRKPAPLTSEERRLVRHYPEIGSDLVAMLPYVAAAAAAVRDAQERVDGEGYPNGSCGDDVWIGVRIVAVADAYDTMTHARVFRDAMTPSAAMGELLRNRGSQFDSRVVDALTAMVRTD